MAFDRRRTGRWDRTTAVDWRPMTAAAAVASMRGTGLRPAALDRGPVDRRSGGLVPRKPIALRSDVGSAADAASLCAGLILSICPDVPVRVRSAA